jgi:hypothetical protein
MIATWKLAWRFRARNTDELLAPHTVAPERAVRETAKRASTLHAMQLINPARCPALLHAPQLILQLRVVGPQQ